ncbi:(deoxy)nucleoside triphosphate pyrophosphohydrolase [Paenibacillus anseongense]|uniref:(deoxy)nucleoside triphosphate pyrophosphohydrolase n=1 Tax=Paenibacillus anseongense TaxID=2682845 RepID=UPI002DBF3F77|nr:(deoxy)nucleoside triphosphate pyrophosphohydrolase [Paenibacillus anseongense]MEC0269430.1 (deoxy)nucleoside triphosphate pyrophosphohydrolase [Paenibacillus anseongense]
MKIVAAALLINEGKILIAQRKSSDKLAGKWEFPGGKQEPGESLVECLKREINEEFGIDVKVGEFFDQNTYHYESGSIELHAYWCTWTSGEMIPVDHDDVRWVSIDEMSNYDFAPADVPFVNKLRQTRNRDKLTHSFKLA